MLTVKRRPSGIPTMFNMFDDIINANVGAFRGSFMPSVNVAEHDKGFSLELAAPGFDKGDFDVHVEKDVLRITGKKETKEEVKEKNYTRREFSFGSFERSFNLPETVDGDSIVATYSNGILHIELPLKAADKVETKKQIEIK